MEGREKGRVKEEGIKEKRGEGGKGEKERGRGKGRRRMCRRRKEERIGKKEK